MKIFLKCAKDLKSHFRNSDIQMDNKHMEVFNIINLQANANKKQWFTTTHPTEWVEWIQLKTVTTPSAGEEVEHL